MTHITSRENSLLRKARAVRDGEIHDLIFAEGLRLCEEALNSGLDIEALIYSEEISEKERAKRFLTEATSAVKKLAIVSERLLASISYTKTPQGIVALARRPETGKVRIEAGSVQIPLLVVIHQLNNPVNVGAILRSAEAAGATGVITTETTADPFSPKALRGAMGSAFRLPMWTGVTYFQMLQWCGENGLKTVCADVEATTTHTDFDWKRPTALIVGPESDGLSAEEIAAAGGSVRIPMQGDVESLNVGVATGILLFEAARQRAQR